MKLKKLKLNFLSEEKMKDKEMNALRGGADEGCKCSCYWEGNKGSSSDDNMGANYTSGTKSKHGCNQYWMVGSGVMECGDCTD